jgi:thiol-disulfide isomerase/thioredoxin
MRWRRTLRTLLLAAAALLGLPCAAGPAAAGAELNHLAPALVVPQLNGASFDLAAQRGKVVIVNYWASWCSPCRAEMPVLDAFYRRYRARGLVLIGLSVDRSQDRPQVLAIMQPLSYPGALAASATADGFGPPLAVPMTFIIDGKGIVRTRLVSGTAVSEPALAAAVLPLLAQLPGAAH